MKLSFEYGTRTINFSVVYRKRRTIEICVEPPDAVTAIVPLDTPEGKIVERVKSCASWIVQQLADFKFMEHRPINREFVNGESFIYLGRNYTLQLVINESLAKPVVKLYKGKFIVSTPTRDDKLIGNAMEQWYRKKAQKKIQERVKYYQHKFSKAPSSVRVKDQKKRWGSCTAKGDLLFNWRCVMAPSPVLDYIVVHEMCHLANNNHSKTFWNAVSSILPDYDMRRDWLRNNGIKLNL